MGHKTLDDVDAASHFKFKKGERVVARRERSRVRQAYYSAKSSKYEVEGEDGTLFMAPEGELRRG